LKKHHPALLQEQTTNNWKSKFIKIFILDIRAIPALKKIKGLAHNYYK